MSHYRIGDDASIDEHTLLGYRYEDGAPPAVLGDRAIVRAGSIIYADVEIGDDFQTGHNALVREQTRIGDDVTVGTNVVIDGTTTIGSHVSLQTGAYIPTESRIGDEVFVGPRAVLTNDRYPVRSDGDLAGPRVADGATIGANATVLPDVTIGENAFVAAGSVVTEDIPSDALALGAPAETRALPEQLSGGNSLA